MSRALKTENTSTDTEDRTFRKKSLCHSLVWYTLFIKIVVVKLQILRYEQLFRNLPNRSKQTHPYFRNAIQNCNSKFGLTLQEMFHCDQQLTPCDRDGSLPAKPISVRKAKSSKRKSPQIVAHLANFSKNVSTYSHVHNRVILTLQ